MANQLLYTTAPQPSTAPRPAADAEPSLAAPSLSRPRVDTFYASPLHFGVSATGGTAAECFVAVIDQMREMCAAGLIGPGTVTDAGHELLNAAQDATLATEVA